MANLLAAPVITKIIQYNDDYVLKKADTAIL